MRLKDLFGKDNLNKCTPVYGILIFICLIYLSSFVILRKMDQITGEIMIFILCETLLFLMYICLVLFICYKKYKRIAYIVSYLPLVSVIFTTLFIYYVLVNNFYSDINKKNLSQVQKSEEHSTIMPNNSRNPAQL